MPSIEGLSRPASFRVGSAQSRGGSDFSSSLSAAIEGRRPTSKDPHEAAEEMVAITLVQPVLAQLRESTLAAEPFAPGEGEKKFGALYDAEIARRIVRQSGFPLVDALARQMRERSESAGLDAPRGMEAADHEPDRSTDSAPLDRLA